jgi:hypothetical protein
MFNKTAVWNGRASRIIAKNRRVLVYKIKIATENEKTGLMLKMNYTLTEINILRKKDAENDFDSICTNNIIVVYIP